MGAFEYRQAEEIRDAFAAHGVDYLFLGKSGAILLGFPDTTQDADLFVRKTPENGRAIVAALRELKFDITNEQAAEIERGKDFVQLKNGPFDLDLVLHHLAWSDSMTLGNGELRWPGFPSATWMTSSPARRQPGDKRTGNPCHD
jgi:hypothetical protein